MDHLVPLAVDVPEVYRMVSPRSISSRALHVRASEVKVKGREGFHRDSGMVRVLVKKRRVKRDGQRFPEEIPRTCPGRPCTARGRHENLREPGAG